MQASEDGMGIVLLQQFLPQGSNRKCGFLGRGSRIEYRGIGYQRLSKLEVHDRAVWCGRSRQYWCGTFGNREPVLWSTVTPLIRGRGAHWRRLRLTVRSTSCCDALADLAGAVIASALPLDWMIDRRLLTYAIGLSVRPSGTL